MVSSQEEVGGRGGAVGGDPADAFRAGRVDQGDRAADGPDRNTIRSALRSAAAPRYSRPAAGSKLDPFRDEIHRLLKADAKLPGSGSAS